jgi:hypothetical protein
MGSIPVGATKTCFMKEFISFGQFDRDAAEKDGWHLTSTEDMVDCEIQIWQNDQEEAIVVAQSDPWGEGTLFTILTT